MPAVYLDSSALVKLVIREPESAALLRHLKRKSPLISSALARTEVLRALLPSGEQAVARGREVLLTIDLVRVSDRVLNAAGALMPADLRSLDAMHLATAHIVGPELGHVVTYDERQASVARALGIRVVAPS
jgi:predicted nucleic acid-binding protein